MDWLLQLCCLKGLKKVFPNPYLVFLKLLVSQIVFGGVSLLVCHQFGVNPFGTAWSLSNWFMNLAGHNFCMFACGLFYMAGTVSVVQFFLSLEEVDLIEKRRFLFFGTAIMISIFSFLLLGADVVGTMGLIWVFGAGVGSVFSLEAGARVRPLFA
ncbi:hypothetical protein B9G69_004780 [Bdellovibrio sp. SKB1291214]|uniref:hypothetical protein n=1 Tax=Bdellovibrio sp. SKB1291214 TaxID=1732569 RepID=UPI00223F1076|nr:hypothetical protein [Bdellovibrio sp. SKB1291214]UYL09888.1 hypothetical protein B9G69_004780 [Bdellovibrio sp. SKB1291214]